MKACQDSLRNYVNWSDLRRRVKSASGTTQIPWIYDNYATVSGPASCEHYSVYFVI